MLQWLLVRGACGHDTTRIHAYPPFSFVHATLMHTHTHTHTHTHAHTHTHTHTRDADTFENQPFHYAFGKLLKSLEGADAPPSICGTRSKVAILVH